MNDCKMFHYNLWLFNLYFIVLFLQMLFYYHKKVIKKQAFCLRAIFKLPFIENLQQLAFL